MYRGCDENREKEKKWQPDEIIFNWRMEQCKKTVCWFYIKQLICFQNDWVSALDGETDAITFKMAGS